MEIISQLFWTVVAYLRADWSFLLLGILVAVSINVYLDPVRFRKWMEQKAGASIWGSIAFGTFTPLCACGTMAVLLSMFMGALPWGPVMAFLVSSPLTSPSEYIFETAVLGGRLANAMVISSVILGLLAGWLAHQLSRKTSFFSGQLAVPRASAARAEAAAAGERCCNSSAQASSCACSARTTALSWRERLKVDDFLKSFVELGIKKVLFYFVLFILVGRIANMLIPESWIIGLFGAGRSFSIPLAATLGLPLYVSGPSALPLVRSFLESGAGEGAILAFLIAGKATGIPVIAGLSTIIRRKALLFYVAFIYFGAIAAGYLLQLFL